MKKKPRLADLSLDQFQAACDRIGEDVYETLNPAGVCRAYVTEGAGGPAQARALIAFWKEKIKEQ